MLRLPKVLLVALLTLAFSFVHAFPLIWSKSLPGASQSKVIQDSASNLYVASRTPIAIGRKITVQKYNAVGILQWQYTADEVGPTDTQYSIRSLAVSPSRLVVLYQDRTVAGEGDFIGSKMLVLDAASGQFVDNQSSSMELEHVGYGGQTFAVQRYSPTTHEVLVDFYDQNLSLESSMNVGAGTTTTPQGRVALCNGIVVDRLGRAYIAFYRSYPDEAGTAFVYKVAKTFIEWAGRVPKKASLYFREHVSHLAVDTASNTVYVLATAQRSTAPHDLQVYAGAINASTGSTLSSQQFVSDSQGVDDFPIDLSVVEGVGAFASAFRGETNSSVIKRFGANGQPTWQRVLASPSVIRGHAHDPAGNLLLLSNLSSNELRVSRFLVGTGVVTDTINETGPAEVQPRTILSDHAGNVFVNYDFASSSNLARLQFARLNFPANIVPGGTTQLAEIELASPNVVVEAWALKSSNPSVVSIPSTLTIARYSKKGSFSMTVASVTSPTNVSINVSRNGTIVQRTLTVVPVVIKSVTISPVTVTGGNPTQGTVTLTGKAPSGGLIVNLASDKPNVAPVPSSVTVPEGSETSNFAVTTNPVSVNQIVTVMATVGSVTKSSGLGVNAPFISSISVTPTTVQGGHKTVDLTINISGIAPAGGWKVLLSSDAPGVLHLPPSATVLADHTSVTVKHIYPTVVHVPVNILIRATRSGVTRTTTLTVTP